LLFFPLLVAQTIPCATVILRVSSSCHHPSFLLAVILSCGRFDPSDVASRGFPPPDRPTFETSVLSPLHPIPPRVALFLSTKPCFFRPSSRESFLGDSPSNPFAREACPNPTPSPLHPLKCTIADESEIFMSSSQPSFFPPTSFRSSRLFSFLIKAVHFSPFFPGCVRLRFLLEVAVVDRVLSTCPQLRFFRYVFPPRPLFDVSGNPSLIHRHNRPFRGVPNAEYTCQPTPEFLTRPYLNDW